MSENTNTENHHDEHHLHSPWYYVKIWGILLILMIISLIFSETPYKWVTIIAAFGIGLVKAVIVAALFMHLNVEKKYIHYMLYSMLLFVGLFFAGVAPDIWNTKGTNWINKSAETIIEENKDWEKQLEEH